jgi:hypothetical protein
MFSVGELIASGYASFIINGIGKMNRMDPATLFHPGPCK